MTDPTPANVSRELLNRLRLLDGLWTMPEHPAMAENAAMYIITWISADQGELTPDLFTAILDYEPSRITALSCVQVCFPSNKVVEVLKTSSPRTTKALKSTPPDVRVEMTFKQAIAWVIEFVMRLISPVSEGTLSPATA